MKLYLDEKTVKKQGYSYDIKEKKGNLTISLKKFGIPLGSIEIEKELSKKIVKELNEAVISAENNV